MPRSFRRRFTCIAVIAVFLIQVVLCESAFSQFGLGSVVFDP